MNSTKDPGEFDVLVVGGGPGGATAALLLARAGLRVAVIDKDAFPRFHIGESLLPRNFPLVQELGLETRIRNIPHVPKFGAEFGMCDDFNTQRFMFDTGLLPGSPTINTERAAFDKMILDAAIEAGAVSHQPVTVKDVLSLKDGDVRLSTNVGEFRGKWLLDASGHGTIVGRHLGLRRTYRDPNLQRVAYFSHFENVKRLPGREGGHPGIFMCDEGWFWMIAIDDHRVSVGFVTDARLCKTLNIPPTRMLDWAMRRAPVVWDRVKDALDPAGPTDNRILADFSYSCKPYAGDGYFMVGDAAVFLDPIFSTGATLAMMGAKEAANHVIGILNGSKSAPAARREYIAFVENATGIFFRLIRKYYRHSFRELFLNGTGPMQVHNAVISILAGQIFPKAPWSLRWRLRLFELCVFVNQYFPLVPRRARFSLAANVNPAENGVTQTPAGGSRHAMAPV